MEDTDLMPWGIHKGKEMQDVPASYLLYLHDADKCDGPVKKYIESNMNALIQEVK